MVRSSFCVWWCSCCSDTRGSLWFMNKKTSRVLYWTERSCTILKIIRKNNKPYSEQAIVFLGILYPPNVHLKWQKGTEHRGKLDNGQTKLRRAEVWSLLSSDTIVLLTLDTIVPLTTFYSNMPRRKVFSNREKLRILSQINKRQRAGESLRSCCRSFDLQPSQVRRWRNAQQGMSNPEAANLGSLHVGRGSILSSFQEELMRWIFELREQGFMLSVRLFTLRVCELSALFRRKTNR